MICKYPLKELYSVLVILICLEGIAISLPVVEPIIPQTQPKNQLSIQPIKQIAKSITVKILSKGFLATGTLIKKQGKVYTVITNDHVLKAANPPYQVVTPDGHVYPSQVERAIKFKGNDLGLLQFTANQVYQIASVEDSTVLTVGDQIFVSGFIQKTQEIIFTKGNVSLLLDKPLEGGYQLGYTNDIQKGMSGGPVLNTQGKLVGINGLHKNLLEGVPDWYSDGSRPCKPLQDIISNSSWAIPMETLVQLAPEFVHVNRSPSFNSSLKANKSYIDHLVLQMQAKSDAAKSCK